MFDQETLDYLREERFLINEAKLVFYVDGNQGELPDQLFLYKYDFNSYISDYYTSVGFGPDAYGGILEYDDLGNPEKYTFRITNYISQVLSSSEPIASSKLALRNFVETDDLNNSRLDSTVQDWNFIPKDVVLYGNRPETNDKRLKLEIYFSK